MPEGKDRGNEGGRREREESDKRLLPTADQVERVVQRRVADALASAGVSPGIISREVLFMLPTEFVQVYVEVFDRALKESVVGSGMGAQGDKANPTRRVRRTGALRDTGKGGLRVKNAEGKMVPVGNTQRAVVQVGAGGGGRRYKEYWVVRDERAFEVKRRLDRKLRRLAGEARKGMAGRGMTGAGSGERAETREGDECWCNRCSADLTLVKEHLGIHLRHCPACGYWLGAGAGAGAGSADSSRISYQGGAG